MIDRAREFTPATRRAAKEHIGKYRTASVTKTGQWEEVTLEFQAGANGGNLALGFIALGPGKAWFDDFRVRKLEEKAATRP